MAYLNITDVFLYDLLLFGYLYRKCVIVMVFSKFMNKKYELQAIKMIKYVYKNDL